MKTKFFRQKYKKHKIFMPRGYLYLLIVENSWHLKQFQQKIILPRESFGQIKFKNNNTATKYRQKSQYFQIMI